MDEDWTSPDEDGSAAHDVALANRFRAGLSMLGISWGIVSVVMLLSYGNGFHGECSVNPCALDWCPDYKPGTYIPGHFNKRSDPTVCEPARGAALYILHCERVFTLKPQSCALSPTGRPSISA